VAIPTSITSLLDTLDSDSVVLATAQATAATSATAAVAASAQASTDAAAVVKAQGQESTDLAALVTALQAAYGPANPPANLRKFAKGNAAKTLARLPDKKVQEIVELKKLFPSMTFQQWITLIESILNVIGPLVPTP